MRVVYSQLHRQHDPLHDVQAGVPFDQLERPSRAERIREALTQDADHFSIESPTEHGAAPIEAVHASGLIEFLETSWGAWRASSSAPEMIPDTIWHVGLREGMDPAGQPPMEPIGRVGQWCFDTGTPIVAGTYAAARSAVDVALTATDLVLHGESVTYGLCRPPGHHAARAVFGGFCYFNNAAIGAEYAARETLGRIAVLDLDYHHGNGTQQVFYRREDVLYVSLHGDPRRAYPYFTGHADETGAGPGTGANLNIPLPAGIDDDAYVVALDRALEALTVFKPEVTIVSLGIDTYAQDPLGDFSLTTLAYRACGQRLRNAVSRLVVLQEGGYFLPHLGENVRQFLLGAQIA